MTFSLRKKKLKSQSTLLNVLTVVAFELEFHRV
jgi:hypothetical protein